MGWEYEKILAWSRPSYFYQTYSKTRRKKLFEINFKIMKYFFYIVRCSDDSLYSGITTDLKRRINEHNLDGKKGAKYLRAKKPVQLIYSEKFKDRNSALVREAEVKKLSKSKKEALIKKISL